MKQDNILIKTDYDNFKSLEFFRTQYVKAQEMLREVADFNRSFLDSKLLSVDEVLSDDRNWLLFGSGTRFIDSVHYYSAKLCDDPMFITEYVKNNKSLASRDDAKDYISSHIDVSEKTFRYYIENFIEAYKDGKDYYWHTLEDERPIIDTKNFWEHRIKGYQRYNRFGEFSKRYWDVRATSSVLYWLDQSFFGGGTAYGKYFQGHDCLLQTMNRELGDVIKDAYEVRPDVELTDDKIVYHPGTVNQELVIERVRKHYHDAIEQIKERISKYGIRQPYESYRVMLMGDERGAAFKDRNVIFNPHKVKCIVDRKTSELIPFMDDKSDVNIEIKKNVLRCTSVTKNCTEEAKYFSSYKQHYVHIVTLDFDMKTNELVNTKVEDIDNPDRIWKQKL